MINLLGTIGMMWFGFVAFMCAFFGYVKRLNLRGEDMYKAIREFDNRLRSDETREVVTQVTKELLEQMKADGNTPDMYERSIIMSGAPNGKYQVGVEFNAIG